MSNAHKGVSDIHSEGKIGPASQHHMRSPKSTSQRVSVAIYLSSLGWPSHSIPSLFFYSTIPHGPFHPILCWVARGGKVRLLKKKKWEQGAGDGKKNDDDDDDDIEGSDKEIK